MLRTACAQTLAHLNPINPRPAAAAAAARFSTTPRRRKERGAVRGGVAVAVAVAKHLLEEDHFVQPPQAPFVHALPDGGWTQEPVTDEWFRFHAHAGSTSLGAAMRPLFMGTAAMAQCACVDAIGGGRSARHVCERASEWRAHAEEDPRWLAGGDLPLHLAYGIRKLAAFVGAASSELQLLPNATALDAASTALRHHPPLRRNDRVLVLEGTRPDLRALLESACRRAGAELVAVGLDTSHPAGAHHGVVAALERSLTRAHDLDHPVRLAVFEHTGMVTGFRAPISELAAVCKARNPDTTVMVDGSLALVAHHVDLGSGGGHTDQDHHHHVDHFLAECHRFMGVPQATSMLWTNRNLGSRERLRTGSDGGLACAAVVLPSVPDFSTALSLVAALDFWRTIGGCSLRTACMGARCQHA